MKESMSRWVRGGRSGLRIDLESSADLAPDTSDVILQALDLFSQRGDRLQETLIDVPLRGLLSRIGQKSLGGCYRHGLTRLKFPQVVYNGLRPPCGMAT